MPSLSVCLIAKNEAQNLPRALASVDGVANEIVVTDTGSTDDTVEVARQCGARVLQFDWVDDFAAAHNFCKSHASGDWILMLDADEELLPECRNLLRECLDQDRVLAFSLLRQDLIDASRPDLFTEMWHTRLYRNLPGLKFIGRCHHHFDPPLEAIAARDGYELRSSEIRLRHFGYVAALRPQKLQRAARLLELELKDRPDQFYYLVELGITRLALGDPTSAQPLTSAAQMLIDGAVLQIGHNAQAAMLLEYTIANRQLPINFPISRAAASDMARQYFPKFVPLLWQLALQHYAAQKFSACADMLEHILYLGRTHTYDRMVSFDPAIMGDAARLNLAVCSIRLGRLEPAQKLLRSLLDSSAYGQQAAENLKQIERLQQQP